MIKAADLHHSPNKKSREFPPKTEDHACSQQVEEIIKPENVQFRAINWLIESQN